MWTDYWREAKGARKFEGGPSQRWHSKHASGYEIGEVDAGRYMATDPDGNGVVDETGDYVAFPNSDDAKRYVEAVISNPARKALPMPYYSNVEIKSAPPQYEPARENADGSYTGPSCCGQKMKDNGGCSTGCCDDYKCEKCGHKVRIEWPD